MCGTAEKFLDEKLILRYGRILQNIYIRSKVSYITWHQILQVLLLKNKVCRT